MIHVEISPDLLAALKALLLQVATEGEHVLLTRQGQALAALISVEDLEVLQAVEEFVEEKIAEEALSESATLQALDEGTEVDLAGAHQWGASPDDIAAMVLGVPCHYQQLYLTVAGQWIFHYYSETSEGETEEIWTEIPLDIAVRWFDQEGFERPHTHGPADAATP